MTARHRRSRVWRGTLGRAMGRHYWRFTVWFPRIGPQSAYNYRLWLGSRWSGTRALVRQDRAKRESDARRLAYRRAHWLDGALSGTD